MRPDPKTQPRIAGAVANAAISLCKGLILAGALVTAGCNRDAPAKAGGAGGAAADAPPAPVTVAKATQQDVPVQIQVIGAVEPYSTVTIKGRVSGQLVKVAFARGEDVNKGDLLFEIDRRPYEAALAMAKANLARDTAQARNSREEAQFQEEIFRRNAGTQRELDRAAAAADAADAQVRADQAAVQTAQVQLDYCTITSPIHGRTGDLMVHEGSVIKADDTAMVVINQIQPVYVTFSVAERYLPQVRGYLKSSTQPLRVEAILPQTTDRLATGELTFVDNQVDRMTGMIDMKGTFANEDRQLWPGQFVNVALTLTIRHDVVVVPSQSVQTSQDGQFVFVIKPDRTAVSVPVTAGLTWHDMTIIDKGDVKSGQTVVTEGQLRLIDGSKASIINVAQSHPATSNPAGNPGR